MTHQLKQMIQEQDLLKASTLHIEEVLVWCVQYLYHFRCNSELYLTCHASQENVLCHIVFQEIISMSLVHCPKHSLVWSAMVVFKQLVFAVKGKNWPFVI